MYSDGGLITNFPLQFIPEEERLETIAISIRFLICEKNTLENLPDFLMRPFQIFMYSRSITDGNLYPQQTIVIYLDKSNTINFEMGADEKLTLIAKGREAVRTFIKKYQKPMRRYSVS